MENGGSPLTWRRRHQRASLLIASDGSSLFARSCSAVYNIVLQNEHTVLINEVECVTLGHGFAGPVVEHDYFGTSRVIEDLKRLPGWAQGRVELPLGVFTRHTESNLVCGLTLERSSA